MRRYWWKIGLGMAMVFALGMTIVSMVQAGKAKVQYLAGVVGSRVPLELSDLPVRFDGRTIGNVTGIRVRRASRRDTGEVTVRVALRDRGLETALSSCDVAVESVRRLKGSTRIRCAGAGEAASGRLVRIGEVVFEPVGLSRPLYLAQGDAHRWLGSEIRSLDADVVRDGEGRVRASGRFDMAPHHGRPDRGTFDLVAGDGRARFIVRDERGREIVNFTAGDGGLNIRIEDGRRRF